MKHYCPECRKDTVFQWDPLADRNECGECWFQFTDEELEAVDYELENPKPDAHPAGEQK